MNLSRTANDPFRFLKRTRTTTPQKILPSPLQEQHDVSIQPILPLSLANSCISAIDEVPRYFSHYDPEKYYSSKCENYLALINFSQARVSPHQTKTKTSQYVDSLQDIMSIGANAPQQRFPLELASNELTFKKIQSQAVKEIGKQQKMQKQPASFRVEDYEITDPPYGEKKQCSSCGRFFILASYEKHVRVCEQVFCKKRKPFSSQKQRSLSKDKKPETRRQ